MSAEKDAEIDRLKDKICGLEKLNQMTDEEVVMELKSENDRLKALLTRAADALERVLPMKKYAWLDWHPYYDLKDELRKAVQ
jgi:hypothetical protein